MAFRESVLHSIPCSVIVTLHIACVFKCCLLTGFKLLLDSYRSEVLFYCFLWKALRWSWTPWWKVSFLRILETLWSWSVKHTNIQKSWPICNFLFNCTVNKLLFDILYYIFLIFVSCFFVFFFFKDGTIKIKDLTSPELIGIMDTCFCCLVRIYLLLVFNVLAFKI